MSGLEEETKLLSRVETLKLQESQSVYAKRELPKSQVEMISEIGQVLRVPPHLAYGAFVFEVKSRTKAAMEFFKLSKRLLGQLEVQVLVGERAEAKPEIAQSDEVVSRTGEDSQNALGNVCWTASGSAMEAVDLICNRFNLVVRQLSERQRSRDPFLINDEYDLQYLLHALLCLYLDDIRPEEWTPSYAGSSARMDFLIKDARAVIETKKSREGLDAKKIGEELIIDIAHYKKHPDCDTLVCFVYDPDKLVMNPRGLENDLYETGDFTVKVFVRS